MRLLTKALTLVAWEEDWDLRQIPSHALEIALDNKLQDGEAVLVTNKRVWANKGRRYRLVVNLSGYPHVIAPPNDEDMLASLFVRLHKFLHRNYEHPKLKAA